MALSEFDKLLFLAITVLTNILAMTFFLCWRRYVAGP